jgi:hypothetical protein
MYTSLGLVVMAGFFLAPTGQQETPTWRLRYDLARQEGQREGKPLAVVIGTGKRGFEGLSAQGKLSQDARRLLGKHFIPVYVDTSTSAGQKLADAFAIAETGLVLSDKSGENQAFYHEGTLADDMLTRQLRRFSNPPRVARTTERLGSVQVSFYPPLDDTTSTQNVPGQLYVPSYFGGGFGGGCRT